MVVDGSLFLVLRAQVSQFTLEIRESIHHGAEGFCQLRGLVAHLLDAVLCRSYDIGALTLLSHSSLLGFVKPWTFH